MKTSFLGILMLALLGLGACSSDDNESKEPQPAPSVRSLVLSNTTFPASGKASTLSIKLRSDAPWKVEMSEEVAKWVKVTPSEGTLADSIVDIQIELTRNLNSNADYRQGKLNFCQTENTDVAEEFTITQYTDYDLLLDSAVLWKIYEKLGGENWEKTWDPATSIYDWAGVGIDLVDGKNRVVSFAFTKFQNIVGELPEELGELTGLKILGFKNEPGLRGNFPVALKNTLIEHIEFSGCTNFGDKLPASLQDCETLLYLTLANCNYSGYEEGWAGNFPALLTFIINNNKFSGPLDRTLISGMSKLVLFEAKDNNFSGELPKSLFAGKDMMAFGLSGNRFTGDFPTIISNLPAYKNSTPQKDVCPQQDGCGFTDGTCYAVE